MTNDAAKKVIEECLAAKGIRVTHWSSQECPSRVVFLAIDKVGMKKCELALKRSWRKEMIVDWIDRNVVA